MKTLLGGNSGSEVFLYSNASGQSLVRKRAKTKEQNNKLQQQYRKHVFFSQYKSEFFGVPKIVTSGLENGYFFFDYEYIHGDTLITYIQKRSISDSRVILDICFNIIDFFSKQPLYFEKEFSNKTFGEALCEKIRKNCTSLYINESLQKKLLTMAEGFGQYNKKTLTHGDFSFDNIVIDAKNKIWLIDYHVGFYPHYYMDIAKIFQDIDGRWYEIKHDIKIDEIKISQLNDYMKKKTGQLSHEYMRYHSFFMAMVFLRSLPYMEKKLDKTKVLRKIEIFVNSF